MIQLSSPTRVTPPSWTVPRFTVTYSRKVLPSPISSRVGSPAYFLSCGSPPIAQKAWKRLPRPMTVGPWMTACAPTVQSGPISTSGPITAYGPTCTLGSIRAAGSTMAVGWMRSVMAVGPDGRAAARSCRGVRGRRLATRDVAQGAHELRFGHHLAVDARAALELPDQPRLAQDVHLQAQLVARHHRPLEAGFVDAGEVEDGVVVRPPAHGGEGKHAG